MINHQAIRRGVLAVLLVLLALLPAGLAEQEKLPVTSLDMLSQPGIVIAVGLDTPAEASLKKDYPNAKLVPYSDIFLAYLDVANGRVDACVSARRAAELSGIRSFPVSGKPSSGKTAGGCSWTVCGRPC